jgi:peptide deformylase
MSRDMKYIGMDVRKEAVVIAVLNSSGQLVMESIVETKASSILHFIHGLRGELHVTRLQLRRHQRVRAIATERSIRRDH